MSEDSMNMPERQQRRGPMRMMGTMGMMGMVGMMIRRMMGRGDAEESATTEVATEETALDILKRRFANAEITKKEFLEMKELVSD